jgi:hypothetical protein
MGSRAFLGMRKLDLALIFPIKDEPSAWLMSLKAVCLYQAGVISEAEKQQVHAAAAAAIDRKLAA